jgi:hypothetical protein
MKSKPEVPKSILHQVLVAEQHEAYGITGMFL